MGLDSIFSKGFKKIDHIDGKSNEHNVAVGVLGE